MASRVAKIVFKSETQNYVICPYCKEIHVHHVDFGTQDRPANCLEGADQTYTIQGKYSHKDIAQALISRDIMVTRKQKKRDDSKAKAGVPTPGAPA